jgi:3-oxoacyl-[acyl-carrier protein] reductase
MSDLNGKVAVVTGASKGIGAGIAKSLGAAGAVVVVNYASSKEGADRVVADIKANGGKALAVKGDVAKAADVERLFDETRKAFGKVDVLVNNAGVYKFDAIEQVTEDEFHRQFNTNVLGTLLATREAVKHFGNDGGSVINISSVASTDAVSGGVETEGVHALGIIGSDFEKQMIGKTPLGRLGQPDDIARVAVFLASDDSAWMTGERLAAAGGYR